MITKSGLLGEFNLISSTSWKSIGIPYKWEQVTTESFPKLRISRKTFLVTAIILGFSGFAQVGSAIQMIYKSNNNSFSENTDHQDDQDQTININWASLILVSGLCFVHFGNFALAVYLEPELTEEWISQTLNFERLHMTGNRPQGENFRRITKLAVLTCKLIRISMFNGFPWIIAIGSMVMPFIPVNLANVFPGTVVLNWIEQLGLPKYLSLVLEKGFAFSFNFVLYKFVFRIWAMLVVVAILGCMALSESLLYFEREFSKEPLNKVTKTYREVQILTKLFNKLMANHLVGTLVLAVILEIVGSLNVIGRKADPNLSMKIYCVWNVVNAIVGVAGLFGFCGDVHDTCANCMDRIKSHRSGNNRAVDGMPTFRSSRAIKERKLVLESLGMVHVNFGAMNYIEKMTPVVFQDFAVQKLVDCLLLQNE